MPSETFKIIKNLYINCSNIIYPICDQVVESDNLCGFSAHFFLEGGTRHMLILMWIKVDYNQILSPFSNFTIFDQKPQRDSTSNSKKRKKEKVLL